ncbi:predicted protein [Nematostella vectensis]|uniref:BHLH domain-containing protein n=1 Tax=Nematostella vectensis TaxID=45351 RepID=A7RYU4_NEMVE|nr:predicted protein [Nematostella vectensis]|eukprot:XP_001635445.1 predicted protein [Nematostella vectensis]
MDGLSNNHLRTPEEIRYTDCSSISPSGQLTSPVPFESVSQEVYHYMPGNNTNQQVMPPEMYWPYNNEPGRTSYNTSYTTPTGQYSYWRSSPYPNADVMMCKDWSSPSPDIFSYCPPPWPIETMSGCQGGNLHLVTHTNWPTSVATTSCEQGSNVDVPVSEAALPEDTGFARQQLSPCDYMATTDLDGLKIHLAKVVSPKMSVNGNTDKLIATQTEWRLKTRTSNNDEKYSPSLSSKVKSRKPELYKRQKILQRKREYAIREALNHLNSLLPLDNPNRKLSKNMILQTAIEYIRSLQEEFNITVDPQSNTEPEGPNIDPRGTPEIKEKRKKRKGDEGGKKSGEAIISKRQALKARRRPSSSKKLLFQSANHVPPTFSPQSAGSSDHPRDSSLSSSQSSAESLSDSSQTSSESSWPQDIVNSPPKRAHPLKASRFPIKWRLPDRRDNRKISIMLGDYWNCMSEGDKRPFQEMARELMRKTKATYPEFKYSALEQTGKVRPSQGGKEKSPRKQPSVGSRSLRNRRKEESFGEEEIKLQASNSPSFKRNLDSTTPKAEVIPKRRKQQTPRKAVLSLPEKRNNRAKSITKSESTHDIMCYHSDITNASSTSAMGIRRENVFWAYRPIRPRPSLVREVKPLLVDGNSRPNPTARSNTNSLGREPGHQQLTLYFKELSASRYAAPPFLETVKVTRERLLYLFGPKTFALTEELPWLKDWGQEITYVGKNINVSICYISLDFVTLRVCELTLNSSCSESQALQMCGKIFGEVCFALVKQIAEDISNGTLRGVITRSSQLTQSAFVGLYNKNEEQKYKSLKKLANGEIKMNDLLRKNMPLESNPPEPHPDLQKIMDEKEGLQKQVERLKANVAQMSDWLLEMREENSRLQNQTETDALVIASLREKLESSKSKRNKRKRTVTQDPCTQHCHDIITIKTENDPLVFDGDICDGQQPEKRKDGQGVAARPCDNWVQCDKCKKWRMLSNNTDPSDLPEKWFCWLNDTNINDCSIPEEKKPIGQASQLMSASYWSLYKKLRISWSSSDDSDDGDDTD